MGGDRASGEVGPVQAAKDDEPAFSEDGVDLTLVRWMLTLTPAERLEVVQSTIRSIRRLRGGEADD